MVFSLLFLALAAPLPAAPEKIDARHLVGVVWQSNYILYQATFEFHEDGTYNHTVSGNEHYSGRWDLRGQTLTLSEYNPRLASIVEYTLKLQRIEADLWWTEHRTLVFDCSLAGSPIVRLHTPVKKPKKKE